MNIEFERNHRKTLTGTVIGIVGDKTVKVACSYKVLHSMYGKEIKRKTVIYVHDEKNQCHVGEVVKVAETRPLSKSKRWRFVSLVSER